MYLLLHKCPYFVYLYIPCDYIISNISAIVLMGGIHSMAGVSAPDFHSVVCIQVNQVVVN